MEITLDNIAEQINSLLPHFTAFITLLLALTLDKVFAEAKRFHYLVGFGWLAGKLEARLNAQPTDVSDSTTKIMTKKLLGFIAWCLLVVPLPVLYMIFIDNNIGYWQIITDAIVLYLAIGLVSLHQHVLQIYHPLKSGHLNKARHFTAYIVSRETSRLSEQEMSRATVESMLENGHDAVIASLIYYLIGGAPLVILHRLANTLDAMWGYKNLRYRHFGYASARLDDLLGFISAKCCTLLYAVQGLTQGVFIKALTNAYRQGNQYKSHNGGWAMAAGATVLNRSLGGDALYHGKLVSSVKLGCGEAVCHKDIPKSLTLVRRASTLLVTVVLLISYATIN